MSSEVSMPMLCGNIRRNDSSSNIGNNSYELTFCPCVRGIRDSEMTWLMV